MHVNEICLAEQVLTSQLIVTEIQHPQVDELTQTNRDTACSDPKFRYIHLTDQAS